MFVFAYFWGTTFFCFCCMFCVCFFLLALRTPFVCCMFCFRSISQFWEGGGGFRSVVFFFLLQSPPLVVFEAVVFLLPKQLARVNRYRHDLLLLFASTTQNHTFIHPLFFCCRVTDPFLPPSSLRLAQHGAARVPPHAHTHASIPTTPSPTHSPLPPSTQTHTDPPHAHPTRNTDSRASRKVEIEWACEIGATYVE